MTVLNRLSRDLEAQLQRMSALWLKAADRGDAAEADRIFAETAPMRALANDVRVAANRNAVAELEVVERALRAAILRQRRVGLSDIAAGTLALLEGAFGPQPDLAPSAAQAQAGGQPTGAGSGAAGGAGLPADAATLFEVREDQPRSIIEPLIAASLKAGIDPITTLTIVEIESDFQPAARPLKNGVPLSSAGGLFQITNDTWTDHGGRPNGTGARHSHAAAAGLEEQMTVGFEIIRRNAAFVAQRLGAPASVEDLYIAHNQGPGGFDKLRLARPGDPVEAAIGATAASNNRLEGLTVAEALGRLRSVVLAARDDVTTRRVRVLTATPAATAPTAGAAATGAGASRPVAEQAARRATDLRDTLAVRTGGGERSEGEEPLRARIVQWFHDLAKDPVVPDDARWIDFNDPTSQPWSAVFISHLLRDSGASKTQFPFSAAHSRYVFHALDRRGAGAPGMAFRRLHEAPLRVGDLVGAGRDTTVRRGGVPVRIPALTVREIEREHQGARRHFAAHCDIVVAIAGGVAHLIGGNVGQTIGRKRLSLDANGVVADDPDRVFVLAVDF